ncbi:sensor histidine kinase [Micromonospora siamensis]|uniref:Two-component system, NarL family, sensor histidine kinase DesK n=1 Tax=Micromonospora siamensis TaxID=299152 RepID=A0A1C5ITZ8_9ACTN|nr:histidine kinase [Micromonospora siamensis]SCG61785.1 two-component system, NarL family, sensor histidine kinase DesK [Micromonospora siamensis]
MAVESVRSGADRRLRRARQVTLAALVAGVWASLALPGVGLAREPDQTRVALGAVALLAFTVAQTAVLYAAVTPWLASPWRRRFQAGLLAVAVLSVPLAGPVAAGAWPTWAWLGATLVGMAPLLLATPAALGASAVVVAVSAAVARWTGGSVLDHLVITGGIGAGIAAVNRMQVWFWDLLVEARQGQRAQARLAAAEERLRFARDVHDLLGHDLTVIALKAELAARLAPVDAGRAGREADEVRRLAGTALHRVRAAVHGYRTVDLTEQLAAVADVLRSCGVRCTVVPPSGALPAPAAGDLAAVLREAGTNVLRHSRAGWCRIEVTREDEMATMTVRNDGAVAGGPDGHSNGLRGLAERLAVAGGTLHTGRDGDEFVLRATVPVRP